MRTVRLLHLRFWTWVGILSYGIYLWHLPLLSLINGLAVDGAQVAVRAVGGVGTGWLRVLLFHGCSCRSFSPPRCWCRCSPS